MTASTAFPRSSMVDLAGHTRSKAFTTHRFHVRIGKRYIPAPQMLHLKRTHHAVHTLIVASQNADHCNERRLPRRACRSSTALQMSICQANARFRDRTRACPISHPAPPGASIPPTGMTECAHFL